MKKRILSLVLCAAMLLSMCLFLGAGVAEDTTAEGSAETTESYIPAVNFTNVAPFVQANAQAANGPARAPMFAANANGGSTTPTDPPKDKDTAGLVTTKTAKALDNDEYKITLTSYTTGTVTEQTTSKPTDIVLVLDQSGSMANCIVCGQKIYRDSSHWKYTEASSISQRKTYYIEDGSGYTEVNYCDGDHYYGACSGGPGWYTSTSRWDHTSKNKITPKDSNHPNGTQFFVRSEEACSSRLSALKKAVSTFVDQVSNEATESKVDHRIAIVGFASTGNSYTNTELLSTNSAVNYDSAKEKDYKDALVSVNGTDGSINSCLTTAIDRLNADGDTYSQYGIEMANKIFAQHSTGSEKERQRVVVVFTDGYTAPYNSDYFKYSMADAAINEAHTSKSTYHATVYTIGIFSNADPTADITRDFKTSDGWSGNRNDLTAVQELTAANRYMHYVSSNYPNAKSLNEGGDPSDKANPFNGGDSYYLSAGDADSLTGIFAKISDNISTPSINLGSKAEVRDIVSPYFTAPANAKGVTVYAEKAKPDNSGGYSWEKDAAYNDSHKMNVAVEGQEVTVSGFDYDANFVSKAGRDETDSKKPGNFHGRRLVVTFTVKAEPGFLGGNNVPTNDATSGVYDEKGTLVENFDYPRVNVPIKAPELTPKDANVYYGGDVPKAEELCTTGDIGKKMADYVKINYSVAGTVTNTTDDTYRVTMTVSPIYNGDKADGEPATEKTASVMSKVNVYKPEITYQDCTTDYGVPPEYSTANFVSTVWKHNGTEAVAADMTGTAPELTFAYEPGADAFTQDTYVQVTVKIGGTNITDAVQFKHKDCSFTGCSFDDTKGQFIVHINVFDLTIKKTAKDGTTIDKNQTFVFRVRGNNNNHDVDMQVVITGPGEQTIKNLPVGDYTITEDTSWSWKYTPDGDATQELKASSIHVGVATVTFKNKNNGTNWLTSLAQVINTWAGGNAQEKTK